MDPETLETRAREAFDAAAADEPEGSVRLAVDPERTRDPLWPAIAATADFAVSEDGVVRVTAFAGATSPAELEAAVVGALDEGLAERGVREQLSTREALFEAHARFRAGQPVPVGFHRAGERVAHAAYAVDLDVFVELRMPASGFDALRGTRLLLAVDEDGIEIELPDDLAPDEFVTLPEAGLLDADEGLDEDDVMPSAGDLYVVFVLYGARQAT